MVSDSGYTTTDDDEIPSMATHRPFDILRMTRDQIREAVMINFKGKKYISFAQLEQLLPTSLILELLRYNEEQNEEQKSYHSLDDRIQADEIKNRALRLLALCVWIGVPMHRFSTMISNGMRDKDLPIAEGFAHPLTETATVKLMLEHQSCFIPYTVNEDGHLLDASADLPLPILFDELDDRIGYGSFSEVFRVEVDSAATPFSRKTILALKRFKPSSDAETIFHRERLVLEELRNRPHNHIVTHLTSIMDESSFYILFPLAQCNLRTFLNRTTAPKMQGNVALWFFSQMKGLADAVLHLHGLGDSLVREQWTPDLEFIPSRPAVHGDLKPENILVFASTSETSWGTFKISDFGSAQTSDKLQRSLLYEEIQQRGTEAYAPPDWLTSNEPTCAADVWSLGCVFLELLIWLFRMSNSEQPGFLTQRSQDVLSPNASFWTSSGNRSLKLKPSVINQLVDLRCFDCFGWTAFEHFILLIWYLLLDDPAHRFSAFRATNDTESCLRQAELDLVKDPNFFLNPPTECLEFARPIPSWSIACWWYNDGPEYAKAAIVHWNEGIIRPGYWSAKYLPRWVPADKKLKRISNFHRKIMSIKSPYVAHEKGLRPSRTLSPRKPGQSSMADRPLYPWLVGSAGIDA